MVSFVRHGVFTRRSADQKFKTCTPARLRALDDDSEDEPRAGFGTHSRAAVTLAPVVFLSRADSLLAEPLENAHKKNVLTARKR